MLLTNEERKRFIEYLEQQIHSNKEIIEQMKNINVSDFVVYSKKSLMSAQLTVLADLLSVEEQSIG